MPPVTEQNEVDAYYLADPTHPRAAGVMWPAIIERRIDKLYETALRPDKVVWNELFQPSGALGNYAVKVRFAYLLGWIGGDIYKDLLTLAKIRNRFAHVIEAKDFADQQLSAWLKNMACYKLLPRLVESLTDKAKADEKMRGPAFTARNTLEDPVSSFRFCIDQMLHHLDQCQENMARNLSGLTENWMTGADLPEKNK